MVEILLLAAWPFEIDAGRREEALTKTHEALERWIRNGLGFVENAGGERLFDPVEVTNFVRWTGVIHQDDYWTRHCVATGRRLVEALRRGVAVAASESNRFRMTLQRSFNLRGFAEGASVRLRAPLPVVETRLHALTVTPLLSGAVQGDVAVREARLEARLLAPADRSVTIAADLTFEPAPSTGGTTRPSDEEIALYLRENEWPIRVTPRIEALAASLARGCESKLEAVQAFWAFMIDDLMYGMVHYSDVPANAPGDWVLEHGWYDCQLGSALLVSLCRAHGVPARLVSGHFLYRLAPTHHYWAEIWIDGRGWLPYDFFSWDLSDGGRDPAWRDIFAGALDDRLVLQCFPLSFTGPMSVRFPPAWQMVVTGSGKGVDIGYFDVEDGSLVYRDHVEVENLGPIGVLN